MKLPIYMDNHSTTPLDPRVFDAMIPCLLGEFGNPSSQNHPFGWRAEKIVKNARIKVAELIGAQPKEIFFTSGTTESNNTALKGIFEIFRSKKIHIITQTTEHKSVLDPCKYLEKQGCKITYLNTDSTGLINLEDLKKAITEDTILISIMFANNEIGTIQPIEAIGKIAKDKNILFHVDAAQAAGKISIDVEKMGIDILSISGHKMYGPKGVGALYVRSKNPHVRLTPLFHGGGQEQGFRSGTLNVPAIAGFGKACEVAVHEMAEESKRMLVLRERLHKGLEKAGGVSLNGHPEKRLPNNLNLSFAFVEAEALIMGINEEIAISASSACSSANPEPSHVLKALNLEGDRAQTAVRFGLGRFNTEDEVDYVIQKVLETIKKLRSVSPLAKAAKLG